MVCRLHDGRNWGPEIVIRSGLPATWISGLTFNENGEPVVTYNLDSFGTFLNSGRPGRRRILNSATLLGVSPSPPASRSVHSELPPRLYVVQRVTAGLLGNRSCADNFGSKLRLSPPPPRLLFLGENERRRHDRLSRRRYSGRDLFSQARTRLASPQYGHPAHVEVAKGYGPCRSCLGTFAEGREERLLFTYDPFAGLDPYPSPGPVFIHNEDCPRYEEDVFPDGLRHLPLTFEGYGEDRWIVAREWAANGEIDCGAIERLLARPEVRYLHVRNSKAGCFIALIERAEG